MSLKYGVTLLVVACAVILGTVKYWQYVSEPWTRNGQVRAHVIQIAPRVSGPIVDLPIRDNQAVKAGDPLFQIDPRTFAASLEQARANYDRMLDSLAAQSEQVSAAEAAVETARHNIVQAKARVKAAVVEMEENEATYKRYERLVDDGSVSKQAYDDVAKAYRVSVASKEQADAALMSSTSALYQAQASLAQAKAALGTRGEDNAQLRSVKAALIEAELNLEFTRVVAPVDGLVTNLNLRLGTQTVTNQPSLALVDVNSFWVDAYFRETAVGEMQVGDLALVTLMSYPDTPLKGRIESIGWGISQQDGSTGSELLPNINPTFEWIRLAQRIPVKIRLEAIPDHVVLRVGTTASVLVKLNSADAGLDSITDQTAPSLLQ